jgi:hypothetical protein
MKKMLNSMLISLLISILLLASCTSNHLTHGGPIDDELTQLIRSIPSAESYPDADVIYILREKTEEVLENGRTKETLHTVFKVLNKRGKDNANIEIGFNSQIQTTSIIFARTITPEGRIISLKKNATKIVTPYEKYPAYNDYKRLTFSMPGVTIGSIIEYKVVREQKRPIIEGKFSSNYFFQRYNPALLCRYKVITPKDMDLKYLPLNPLKDVQSSPKIVHQGTEKTYLWEYRNVPQVMEEDFMPPFEEVAFGVMVTNMDSWKDFSYWWGKLIEGKTAPDKAIMEKVVELTRHLSTNKEKIEVIFDYVKSEIRYVSIDLGKSGYEPESATEVFENKYGDCKDKSTLLISMLKSAGIPAHYVLIPTNDMRNLNNDFPYPFQFDHCIVAAENEGKYHFIDPVAKNYRIDYLPEGDQDRGILIFKDQQPIFGKTPLAKPDENSSDAQYQIKIGKDGYIEGEVKNSGSGETDAFLRSLFVDYSPTVIKEVFEIALNKMSPGAKLVKYEHSDPLNFREKFVLTTKYNSKDYCKKAGNILIFQLPEVGQECAPKGKNERRYPIVSWTNSISKKEAEFNIPDGYQVYYLPEPLEVINPYIEFHSSYRIEGEKIFYQEEFIEKAIRITPEEYPVYKESCQVMGKISKREVLFRKKN